jgi:hypothetical protein
LKLFDEPNATATPAGSLRAAHHFVSQCIRWGEAEITARAAAGRPTAEWESYVRFSQHAREELEAGTLDHWFVPASPSDRDKL